jgi:hypothetical protein
MLRMLDESSRADNNAMPTITTKKGGKKNLVSLPQNPWQTIAGALERLGERDSAVLVLVRPMPSTNRTDGSPAGQAVRKTRRTE